MKILLDTSVIVAALVEPHPHHHRALPWLRKAKEGAFGFVVCSHTVAEVYAVLSTLPVSPRITPGLAWRLVHEGVLSSASVVSLSSSDYAATIKRMSDLGLSGGIVYDALIVKAAQKADVDRLLTFNVDDFKRAWPEGGSRIAAP
ncbi:MAG: PIN domain-containing protein [Nitrospirae bacterium]|nr:PIN domain-containing protein [Nitrospirota bacterium]MBI3393755.1 PIN domain-containing protein [Nitrospirota bacterium]